MKNCFWRSSQVKFIFLSLLLCSFFFLFEVTDSQAAVKDDIPDGLMLLARVGVGIEYGGFIVHQDNYTSQLRRQLEVDVLQFRRHIFYLRFDEKTF